MPNFSDINCTNHPEKKNDLSFHPVPTENNKKPR